MNKYLDRPIGGRFGDHEFNTRKHFQSRILERHGVRVSDCNYYEMCAYAAKKALTKKDKGFYNSKNPDRIYIRINFRFRLIQCIYDFMSGLLVTTIPHSPIFTSRKKIS